MSAVDFEYHSSEVELIKMASIESSRLLHSALFVSTHSLFENTFSEIRKDIEKLEISKIRMKHLKGVGSDLANILNYFKLVHNIEFSKNQGMLDTLKDFIQIRNTIIHQNGHLSKLDESKRKQLIKFIDKRANIEIVNGTIIITKKFVIGYSNFLHQLGQRLFDGIIIVK